MKSSLSVVGRNHGGSPTLWNYLEWCSGVLCFQTFLYAFLLIFPSIKPHSGDKLKLWKGQEKLVMPFMYRWDPAMPKARPHLSTSQILTPCLLFWFFFWFFWFLVVVGLSLNPFKPHLYFGFCIRFHKKKNKTYSLKKGSYKPQPSRNVWFLVPCHCFCVSDSSNLWSSWWGFPTLSQETSYGLGIVFIFF